MIDAKLSHFNFQEVDQEDTHQRYKSWDRYWGSRMIAGTVVLIGLLLVMQQKEDRQVVLLMHN